MRRVYLDNGSTSWPKAPGIGDTIKKFLETNGSNIGRGGYREAYETEDAVGEVRDALARLCGYAGHPECVAFTMNVTMALNFLIKGLLTPEDHVLVSSMEHNAVMRPLVQEGIPFTRIPADREGHMETARLEELVTPRTKAIICSAASNVSGTIQPLEILGSFARRHHLLFLIDAAQGLPFLDIGLEDLGASAIAFTGHKGLLGPQGIGGMVLRDDLARTIDPLVAGGTGSASDSEHIPPYLPDRLEAGTPNLPGIMALGTALTYVERRKQEIREEETRTCRALLEGLTAIPGIAIVGPKGMEGRVPVVSIDVPKRDNADVADVLAARYGIETRVGLHCAPSAHKTLGTFPKGTIRFSPGPFTTMEEIAYTIAALREIMV